MAIDGYMGGIGNSFASISKKEKKNKQTKKTMLIGLVLCFQLSCLLLEGERCC